MPISGAWTRGQEQACTAIGATIRPQSYRHRHDYRHRCKPERTDAPLSRSELKPTDDPHSAPSPALGKQPTTAAPSPTEGNINQQASTNSFIMGLFSARSSMVGNAILAAFLAALVARVPENGWGSVVWFGNALAFILLRRSFLYPQKPNPGAPDGESVSAEGRVAHMPAADNALLALLVTMGFLLPTVHLLTGILSFADYRLPPWAAPLSAVCSAPPLYLMYRSHVDLGDNFSQVTELREDHTLVTSGVYERVRHPMYTAFLLNYAVYPMMLQNWVTGFGTVTAFMVLCVVRIPKEEAMMEERFGDAYRRYCERTGRLLPLL